MPEEVEMMDFETFKERYEKVPVEEYPNNVREAVPDPVVSVHLLTYNHADYIREAIESVLMQDVDFPMEIVLGDDDSSDGTREICIEYAEQHPDLIRLQLHHRENNIHLHGGPTHLFQYWYNTLSARGDYIAILSGDDYWRDFLKLQKQYTFLKANPKYALSFHDFCEINSNSRVTADSKLPKKNKNNFSKEDLMGWRYILPSTYFLLNVFEEIPDIAVACLHEDVLTVALLGESGAGAYQDEVKPTAYRVHDRSIWKLRSSLEKNRTLGQTNKELSTYFRNRNLDVSKKYNIKYIRKLSNIMMIHLDNGHCKKYFHIMVMVLDRYMRFGQFSKMLVFLLKALIRPIYKVVMKI